MKYIIVPLISSLLFITACSSEEATHYERTTAEFLDSLDADISAQQWWRTAVTLRVNVVTDAPVKLMLVSSKGHSTVLYDYKELASSGTVTMTAPQGQGDTLYLRYYYKNKQKTQSIVLNAKPEETVYINTMSPQQAPRRRSEFTPPASLCGNSIVGDARYFQFNNAQLNSYFAWRASNSERVDAKEVEGQICNYELESNGPFYITWVTGNEAEQRSHILGYYYHSPTTYDDITYVDLSETHKWDYIDGLSKVQYQINHEETVSGYTFLPNTWYDGNFDMSDVFGATWCYNMDRVGDNAYNMFAMYSYYGHDISALRGISFKIDVPEGVRIGFYLRSDEEPLPEQWTLLRNIGIKPYTDEQDQFMGTNFCAELMNIVGNGKGKHRSFIKDYDEVYWMGMEDLLNGGDHDCNDVLFGVVSDLKIQMPTIVDPALEPSGDPDTEKYLPFPWTIAYEDVNRNTKDFDFNDVVIKFLPDFKNERCCVVVEAAGAPYRMYLHYDGPDGDVNLGEVHDLLGHKTSQSIINTKSAVASTPFVTIDCVPWPNTYTMFNDAKRFYIEIQRGDCEDCTDVITLTDTPGVMPEAILVAGEWQWPMEGVHIFDAYNDFPSWAKDPTRTRFWQWYQEPVFDRYVSY